MDAVFYSLPKIVRFKCGVIVFALIFSVVQAEEAPLLCSDAADRSVYSSQLRNYRVLQDGTEGWIFRDYDLKTTFEPSRQVFSYLGEFAANLSDRGIQLVLVPIPTRGVLHPEYLGDINFDVAVARANYSKFLDKLRSINILSPPIDNLFYKSHIRTLMFKRDFHWKSTAAHKIGKMTSKVIRNHPNSQKLPLMEYESTVVGRKTFEGRYQKAASEICHFDYPLEEYYEWKTQPREGFKHVAMGAAAKVVLVGTSNSNAAHNWNFSGFLKQYLNAEVSNLAVSGGGYKQSMRDYLKSDAFDEAPPLFLIWEYPAYYNLNDIAFFRELVELTALDGKYRDRHTQEDQLITLQGGQ